MIATADLPLKTINNEWSVYMDSHVFAGTLQRCVHAAAAGLNVVVAEDEILEQ